MKHSLIILLAGAAALSAQDRPIDVERSTITIYVGKTGLFAMAGHDHEVNAPIASGTIGDAHVEFSVDTAKMAVKANRSVDEKTRAQIQKDMEDMTLEIAKYPVISFKSSKIEKTGEGEWKVDGVLSLHGVNRPISLAVRRNGEAYAAEATLKQTDFGIKPVSVAGGAVKVKNEVRIFFQIFARR